MFRFGIELSTYEYDYRRNPKPSHKSNSSAKRTIGFIIAPEVLSIPRKQQRDSEPRHCREHAAGCYPAPLRFCHDWVQSDRLLWCLSSAYSQPHTKAVGDAYQGQDQSDDKKDPI